ncbi:hypothetical protein ABPG75_013991 [Micractinium tetrahymenae]
MHTADQKLLKLILLALHLSFLHRCWADVDWRVLAWQAATVAAFADSISAALRFTSFRLGLGAAVVWRQVNATPPPLTAVNAPGAAALQALAVHAVRLVFASGLVPLLLGTLGLRTRPCLSVLAQAGAVGSNLLHARPGCAGSFFSHPAIQAQTHTLYRALSLVSIGLPLPLAPLSAPADPLAECATVVSFLQLCALLLPALVEAAGTARLLAAHQRQRGVAGLPPEHGACAAAYAAIHDFCCGDAGLPLGVLAWAAVAVARDWPAFLHAHASNQVG